MRKAMKFKLIDGSRFSVFWLQVETVPFLVDLFCRNGPRRENGVYCLTLLCAVFIIYYLSAYDVSYPQ